MNNLIPAYIVFGVIYLWIALIRWGMSYNSYDVKRAAELVLATPIWPLMMVYCICSGIVKLVIAAFPKDEP
jgi:hypothetical protein